MKISVIGLPGSGKTLFAQRVSSKLNIPHIHLDRFWFEAGGMKINAKIPSIELENLRANIKQRVVEATEAESWISDGIYAQVQPYIANLADKVIFFRYTIITTITEPRCPYTKSIKKTQGIKFLA